MHRHIVLLILCSNARLPYCHVNVLINPFKSALCPHMPIMLPPLLQYDPMAPPPAQLVPPFAPRHAHEKDYRAIFYAQMPPHNRGRYVGCDLRLTYPSEPAVAAAAVAVAAVITK
jgi:hypothetical protein